MEKLYKELENYSKKDYYPFHMPGHKRNPFSVDGDFPLDRDITEIDGFDNLHHPMGIIMEAQERLSALYGTSESFYSINGSTAALLTAVSATVNKGGQLLAARNCHKAVYNGMYIRDLQPTYIYPHEDPKLGINGGISPSRVERALEENPQLEAILITSPTYDGVVSDVEKIAEAAHRYGLPLIVDEAHGAHFRFSEYFPVSAVELGADLVIQSLHKTLPSMTQTAVLHCCSDRVDRDRIRRFMGIYQSSSPSYILMASIDACVDKLTRDGREMFGTFEKNLSEARERLEKCRYIRLVSREMLNSTDIFDIDRSKLLFSTADSSINGRELHRILRERFHIQMEMEAENYVLGISSVGDTREGFLRLCEAIEKIDSEEALKAQGENGQKPSGNPSDCLCEECKYSKMKQVLRISQAADAPSRKCLLEESVGKISTEFAYLYPPGIPILVPGEQITGLFVRNVRRYMEQGLEVQGLKDLTNETICIVKE